MGLWQSLFGKKVVLHGRDEGGKPFDVTVPEERFDEWKREGHLKKVEMVEVHVQDPVRGDYIARWEVGKDISVETVEKFKDPATDSLYAVIVYEAGEPQTSLVQHAKWSEIKLAVEREVGGLIPPA